ncbi:hypothetical protein [Promicromonospora iranensis]|uniref:Uncharacterized protein n=1 Tax=Promicromonospora iranensis TaxID=1105144 RepID=A0ABU2CUL5_9MICO|nr:hypothetical protein [Promicromonospora iranensis]MDR7384976.1 hypothetical protein [Promicromonospora iranensis]
MNTAHSAGAVRGVAIAAEIEDALRSVPGVCDLYRSGSLVANVADAGARRLGLRDDDTPLVLVQDAGAGLRVDAAMGVHISSGATATMLAAHRAVRDLLTGHELRDAHIVLTVVHVDDSPSPAHGAT